MQKNQLVVWIVGALFIAGAFFALNANNLAGITQGLAGTENSVASNIGKVADANNNIAAAEGAGFGELTDATLAGTNPRRCDFTYVYDAGHIAPTPVPTPVIGTVDTGNSQCAVKQQGGTDCWCNDGRAPSCSAYTEGIPTPVPTPTPGPNSGALNGWECEFIRSGAQHRVVHDNTLLDDGTTASPLKVTRPVPAFDANNLEQCLSVSGDSNAQALGWRACASIAATAPITATTASGVTTVSIPAASDTRDGYMAAADKSKLDGVESGAEVNADRLKKFSSLDSDTRTQAVDGEIGLRVGNDQFDDNDQLSDVDRIEIAFEQAAFGQDPSNPNTDDDAENIGQFLDDWMDTGGAPIWLMLQSTDAGQIAYVRAASITKDAPNTKYILMNLTWDAADFSVSTAGTSWNIVTGALVLAEDVHGGDRWVERTDLEGHEDDEFGAYQAASALLASGTTYRTGSWTIATNASGAPTASDSQNQDQISSGTATLVVARLQTNSNPDAPITLAPALNASDYPIGRVIHISPWAPYDPDNHLRVTLTTAGTIVGTGDAQYLWATATIAEVGDIENFGDYYRISHQAPSGLDVDLPHTAISDPPWIEWPTTLADDITQTSKILVDTATGRHEATVSHFSEHVRPQTTEARIATSNWMFDGSNITQADAKIGIVNSPIGGIMQLAWSIPANVPLSDGTTLPKSDVVAYFNQHHEVDIYSGSYVIKGNITSFFISLGVHYINLSGAIITGSAPADGASINIKLQSNIPSRPQIADQAYKANSPNIAGAGGTLKQRWGRGNTATNAVWVPASVVWLSSIAGTGDAITATAGDLNVLNTGQIVIFQATAANTGATTLAINSFGAKALKSNANAVLSSGDIASGTLYIAVYDGSAFRLMQ